MLGSRHGAYSALPEPMLAKSGKLPTRGDFAFRGEVGRAPRDGLD
jgi:hypothetical protein